jgi:hypothetical protein
MFTQVILDHENATVCYHKDGLSLRHFFKRYVHDLPFRAVLEAASWS